MGTRTVCAVVSAGQELREKVLNPRAAQQHRDLCPLRAAMPSHTAWGVPVALGAATQEFGCHWVRAGISPVQRESRSGREVATTLPGGCTLEVLPGSPRLWGCPH